MPSYAEKLKDPRWQKKRLQIFERDGFTCQRCGSESETLNAHHLEYSKEPWSVPDESLVTLCETCHEETESLKKRIALHLGSADRYAAFYWLDAFFSSFPNGHPANMARIFHSLQSDQFLAGVDALCSWNNDEAQRAFDLGRKPRNA